jgi:chromate transporter
MTEGAPRTKVALVTIFLLFARIGLTSFGGGVAAWVYREAVHRRRWLTEDEFLAGLTLAQILPGPNVVNISIYVGHRVRGATGSLVAVLALLIPPMFVAVGLLVLFGSFDHLRWLHAALEGVAAAAVGLTFSVAYSAARRAIKANRWALPILAAVFIAIGVLRWPLLLVVAGVAPLALLAVRKKT